MNPSEQDLKEQIELLQKENRLLAQALRDLAMNAPENEPSQNELPRCFAIAHSYWVAGQKAKLTLWKLGKSASRE